MVEVGDATSYPADILVAGANPWLRLTGGVGAALLAAAGQRVANEMAEHLARAGAAHLPTGSIVTTSAGPLPFQEVWHVVTVDHKYKAHHAVVESCLREIFARAAGRHLVLSALGTGYGGLEMVDFLLLLRLALAEREARVTLVLGRQDQAELARLVLGLEMPEPLELPPPSWRVILAVEVLHSWGYQRIRIQPSSDLPWRCKLTSGDAGPTVEFRSDQPGLFSWADADGLAPVHLAALLLCRVRGLAEQGRGLDPAYARWYQTVLLRTCDADNLPCGSKLIDGIQES